MVSSPLAFKLAAVMLTGGWAPMAVKTPIRGLISMGAYKFVSKGGDPVNTLDALNAKPGIFGGIVILASWSEMQKSRNDAMTADNNIDHALNDVRDYNRRNPQMPLAVKLRVWGAFMAPDWAKQLGGGSVKVVHKGTPRVIGRFWSVPYRNAWAQFQDLLAKKYDSEP